MAMFTKGLDIKTLIKYLLIIEQNKKVLIASDELYNSIFKGINIEETETGIIISGLSETETEEY